MYPQTRLRRLRKSEAIRRMTADRFPGPEKFIWPVFVVEGKDRRIPIASMPGQCRMGVDVLLESLEAAVRQGIGGVMLFGIVDDGAKSPDGKAARSANGVVQKAVRQIKKNFGTEVSVWTDVCLCAYTRHGHCGILDAEGDVDNDKTLLRLAGMAVSHAEAGADGVAPSAMMDGQVREIRNTLDKNGFGDTAIMSYSTKFASAFYGPFRDAAGSKPGRGDRKSYQLPSDNVGLAIRESVEDEKEGADILMVKPALCYLDIIAEIKRRTLLPVAAYNVSGEYSMIHACAERGWGDLKAMARESVAAISRAGADIIISYWADRYAEIFK